MNNFLTMIAAAQAASLKVFNVRQVGAEVGEPITLAEARAQCNVDLWGSPPESDDDFWLETIGIPAARAYCENYKGVSYAPRTLELATNGFPAGDIKLPFGPVQSITSIKYDDQDAADAAYTVAYDAEFLSSGDVALATVAGNAAAAAALEQTVAAAVYALDLFTQPATVILNPNQTWPAARNFANSVRVRYAVGCSIDGDSPLVYSLPPTVRGAMLLMLGHLYANREAVNIGGVVTVVPLGVQALLDLAPGGTRTDFA